MAVIINSGDLRKKVVFKQPASSLNDEGGRERTYTEQIVTWADVRGFNQYRATEASRVTLVGAFDFYVRYSEERAAITKDWLINYKGQDYTIHQIDIIDQKERFIRFTAKTSE